MVNSPQLEITFQMSMLPAQVRHFTVAGQEGRPTRWGAQSWNVTQQTFIAGKSPKRTKA